MRSYHRYIVAIFTVLLAISALYITLKNVDSPLATNSEEGNEEILNTSNGSFKRNVLKLFSSDYQETNLSAQDTNSVLIEKKHKSQIRNQMHLLDYLSSPRITPYDYSTCRMSNCFNFSRCTLGKPLAVHIVPSSRSLEDENKTNSGESNLIHRTILEIIRKSKHYEPDAERACIFILEDDTLDRDPLSKSFQPDLYNLVNQNNNYGMNYLIFNLYSGSWPDYKEDDFAGLHFGAAMIAKASNSIARHRQGFDISLPLFSYLHPKTDDLIDYQDNNPLISINRTYFLTFKGKRYVFGRGSDTRNSLYHLDNGEDVILVTTCKHGKKWRESSDSRCSKDESKYDQYDFVSLMKQSLFCLTPRGRRLGSFRYLEALSYGCIPIVLSDGWVKPFNEIIDWSCASIQFSESLLLQVPDMLRDVRDETINIMQNNCRHLYNRYFSSIEKIILTTLSIIEKRIENKQEA